MPTHIICTQPALLKAIADGGRPYKARDPKHGNQQWWLKDKDSAHIRILASTGDAAHRHSYIEPTGLMYWRLTEAGRAELAKLSGVPDAQTG